MKCVNKSSQVFGWEPTIGYCVEAETQDTMCPFSSDEVAATSCSWFEPVSEKDTVKQESIDDPVNHPSHYTAGGIECIDAITAAISCQKDPVDAWLTAQCIKYLWRWPLKNGLEDLKKTRFYLDRLIERKENDKT